MDDANDAGHAMKPTLDDVPHSPAQEAGREWLSALVDGECPPSQLDQALKAYGVDADARQAWGHYHHVGQALRGAAAQRPASPDFVAAVMRQVEAEKTPASPPSSPASRGQAANDAVFRWKMVAGMASVAAVVAVASQWMAAGREGPTLAQRSPTESTTVTVRSDVPLVVNRDGIWRDPQLEALIAAHRQQGSVSALQATAGFMRNATHELPAR
jgi:sigma-E factor negative regulatory protein RseA